MQQNWFADVATRVVLPMFKARARPFVLVYWSRDPDGSQHNQGDSFGQLQPGINGPTSLAGIRNADDNLRRLREALVALDLQPTTNIIVAADHGFSTVSRESATSPAARQRYADVVPGRLPQGFLALDLAGALALPLWDPNQQNRRVQAGEHTNGNGLIGRDPSGARRDRRGRRRHGVDLSARLRRARAGAAPRRRADGAGLRERRLRRRCPGVDSGHAPDERDSSRGPGRDPPPVAGREPAIVLHRLCHRDQLRRHGLERAQQGQGHHGGFGRAESFNFMAAVGPSFKSGFVDTMPVGNVDVHPTIARIMGLPREAGGTLRGRVLEEALVDGRTSRVTVKTLRSKPGPSRSSHRAALSGGWGRALLRRCRVSRPHRWFAGDP